MKRALIVCFAVMTSVVAMSQDVIITMDAKKIEAKILEVSKTEIKYKEQDNLEGPTFVLGVEEISSVIYANGKVVLYNQPEQPKTNVAASPVSKPKEPVKAVPQEIPGRIYKDKGKYRYNGTYIDSKEVALILKRENTFAYDQWKKGKGMLIGGAVCTGIGSGLVVGGLITLVSQNYAACVGMECVALVPLGIGIGLSIGSNHACTKAIDIYNSKYDQAAVQLKYGISANGIGLAISF